MLTVMFDLGIRVLAVGNSGPRIQVNVYIGVKMPKLQSLFLSLRMN